MNKFQDCLCCFCKLPVIERIVLFDHRFLDSLKHLFWMLLAALIYDMGVAVHEQLHGDYQPKGQQTHVKC